MLPVSPLQKRKTRARSLLPKRPNLLNQLTRPRVNVSLLLLPSLSVAESAAPSEPAENTEDASIVVEENDPVDAQEDIDTDKALPADVYPFSSLRSLC